MLMTAALIPLSAAADGRSITISPNARLVDGQYIDVAWSGFPAGKDARARLCPSATSDPPDCAKDSASLKDSGDSKLGRTNPEGNGSTPFIVRAQDIDPAGGGTKFVCNYDHACSIVVFDVDSKGKEVAERASAELKYSVTTRPCPERRSPVAGSGASAAQAAMALWQSEACAEPMNLNVSFISSNSVNGQSAFANQLPDSDYAVSGMPLTNQEKTKLEAAGRQVVYVPAVAGALAFVYNLWFDDDGDGAATQVRDLKLSAPTLAKIVQARIGNWNAKEIAEDNPDRKFVSKRLIVVGRADNSAATFNLTSWFDAVAKDAWQEGGASFQDGPTTVFPAGNGVLLRTGSDAVAREVRTFPGEQGVGDIPEAGFIGFVDASVAKKLGLPVVAVRNEAGRYVQPTPDSIRAALGEATVNPDGSIIPAYATTNPDAYPLPVVNSIITSGTGMDADHLDTLKKFLAFVTTTGQDEIPELGYVALPDSFASLAARAIDKLSADKPTAAAPAGATTSSADALEPVASAASSSSSSSSPASTATSAAPVRTGTASPSTLPAPIAIAVAAPAAVARAAGTAVSEVVTLVRGEGLPFTLGWLLLLGLAALAGGMSLLAPARAAEIRRRILGK